jgi:hypothetical protein
MPIALAITQKEYARPVSQVILSMTTTGASNTFPIVKDSQLTNYPALNVRMDTPY